LGTKLRESSSHPAQQIVGCDYPRHMPRSQRRSNGAADTNTKHPSPKAQARELLALARKHASPAYKKDMFERYGISGKTASTALGVRMRHIQRIAKEARTKDSEYNHALADALWNTKGAGQYEARMLAIYVDEPSLVTRSQMDDWAKGFDNWGIVDTACFSLFDRAKESIVFATIRRWAARKDEFVRRAAFALVASVALHRKDIEETKLIIALALAEKHASDPRNFVKKGVSWALRSCGKRRPGLRTLVRQAAKRLAESPDPASRWVGKDVLRDVK